MTGSFFPLHPGFTWTYRLIDKRQHNSEIFTDRAVILQRNHPEIAGKVISEYSSADGKGKSAIVYLLEGGYVTRLFGFDDSDEILFEEREFLPRFLKPGLRWSNSLLPFGSLGESRILQTHHAFFEVDEVVVPAGHFSGCIRVETNTVYEGVSSQDQRVRSFRYLDWYAPNVGLVKTSVVEGKFFGSEIARVELLSFVGSQAKTESHRCRVGRLAGDDQDAECR